MYDVKAFAIRTGKTIEVTISGLLPNSCYQARIEDIYPGGNRVYLVDPGAAQVFIEETLKPGSDICLLQLVPWVGTVGIPDKTHKKVEIYVNNSEVLEIQVLDIQAGSFSAKSNKKEFIVIARTGSPEDHHVGCSIIPKDALYPAIYNQVFGPSSYIGCKNWVAANCGR
jgi:hypothetical protein